MAKKKSSKKKETESNDLQDRSLLKELQDNYDASDRYINEPRDTWDEKEAMLMGSLKDDISSNSAKSQVFDPRLSTIVLERAARVMGQLPTGKSMAVSQNDKGKNMLMNLTIDKYVLPNANSQFDFLIKSRLLDMYSLVYGVMFGLVDWRVDERSGYVGPDLWILPIRNCFPQAGAISLKECERFQVSTMVSKDYIEQKKDDKTFKNLDTILKVLKDKGGKSKSDQDDKQRSHTEESRHPDVDSNEVELRTEYRTYGGKKDKGEWITYAPDFELVVRQIDNPHENGELPIVAKYCFPLIDSIFGLGEFERGKTLQYAINSLINLYLDGVKMSLFPPIIVDYKNVIKSSIKFSPASKWLAKQRGAIEQIQLSPQGLNTFQSTYSFLNSALVNQAGTTDTTISSDTDPTQGKTPQALKMVAQREGSRDNWDRFMMEQTQEEILRKFVNLISKKQEKPIKLRLFESDIEEISQLYPDVTEVFESGMGQMKVGKEIFEAADFDYQIVPGSTVKMDEDEQVKNLQMILQVVTQNPQFLQALQQDGKTIKFGELFTRIVSMSGISDWDKIVTDFKPEDQGMMPGEQQPPPQPDFQDEEMNQVAQAITQELFQQNPMHQPGAVPAQPQQL